MPLGDGTWLKKLLPVIAEIVKAVLGELAQGGTPAPPGTAAAPRYTDAQVKAACEKVLKG